MILASGISNPILAKNSLIGPAALAGLAVKTNTSLVPRLSAMILATSNSGPLLPCITLLNSEKSHWAPSASMLPASLANVAASIAPVVPSGIVYNTLLLVLANVSSKSNTLIFLIGWSSFLPFAKALSVFSKAFIAVCTVIGLSYFIASGIKSLSRFEAIDFPGTKGKDAFISLATSKSGFFKPSNIASFWILEACTFSLALYLLYTFGSIPNPLSSAIVLPVKGFTKVWRSIPAAASLDIGLSNIVWPSTSVASNLAMSSLLSSFLDNCVW